MSEKIYGICENKCLIETLPKTEIETNYKLNGDFAIIKQTALSNGYVIIDYPEGFNKDNTAVLSVCCNYSYHVQVTSEGVVTESGTYLELNTILLGDDNIQIQRALANREYKVVLMKV